MSRLYLSNPCAFLSTHCTRCCGRSQRPAFPAPSVRERDNELAKLGQIMSRERGGTLRCRPCESRDPYAAAGVVKANWLTALRKQQRPVVMGPCFRRDDTGDV